MITLALFVAACLLTWAAFAAMDNYDLPIPVSFVVLIGGVIAWILFAARIVVVHGETIGRALKFVVTP